MRDAEVGWHSTDADPFAAIRSNRNTKLDNQQRVLLGYIWQTTNTIRL